ncbi:hypothetical protein GCM10007383_12610 [Arenibacter certesii]|uniref:Uncharacterized protein n=1 Tax=Arenibacter certesii TaxID=228955 RepID=A0A918IS37_9FLAO|nr:hypothetical protein GCM10007383_12610 [Arenibacter certesii]
MQTSTIIFEANGTGKVDYIITSNDCIPEQLGCYFESTAENPSLPFKVKVED